MSSRVDRARHFVVVAFFLCVACSSTKSVRADEFQEVSQGNYVRLGIHQDITQDDQRGIANIGFIVGGKSIAVIDPGGSAADAKALKEAIQSRSDLPISHVVLTHFHPDHVLAGQIFSYVDNIVAHRRYPNAMLQRGEHYRQRFAELMGEANALTWLQPTISVNKQHVIDLGQRTLLVRAHPTAHTDNDLSVLDKQTNTLWASDLIFESRLPALDGSLKGWLAVLQDLGKTQPTLVVPGHGKPGVWQETVQPQTHYLGSLLDSTRAAIKAGKSLSQTLATEMQKIDDDWTLFALYHSRNVTKAYAEMEWE